MAARGAGPAGPALAAAILAALAATPAAAQGVPTHPFASNLPSYPRPHFEPSLTPAEASRRREASCAAEADARGVAVSHRRAFIRGCLRG